MDGPPLMLASSSMTGGISLEFLWLRILGCSELDMMTGTEWRALTTLGSVALIVTVFFAPFSCLCPLSFLSESAVLVPEALASLSFFAPSVDDMVLRRLVFSVLVLGD